MIKLMYIHRDGLKTLELKYNYVSLTLLKKIKYKKLIQLGD